MNKLRRLFTRARPESQELNILRGMLASIEQKNKVVSVRRMALLIRPTISLGRARRHAANKTARKAKYLTKTVK
jgi:hypothetical protein